MFCGQDNKIGQGKQNVIKFLKENLEKIGFDFDSQQGDQGRIEQ